MGMVSRWCLASGISINLVRRQGETPGLPPAPVTSHTSGQGDFQNRERYSYWNAAEYISMIASADISKKF